MMARSKSLPDPIDHADAAMWPELVTTPALIDYGTGASMLVECYVVDDDDGAPTPVAQVRFLGIGLHGVHVQWDLRMVQATLAALRAAERDLLAAGAVSVP